MPALPAHARPSSGGDGGAPMGVTAADGRDGGDAPKLLCARTVYVNVLSFAFAALLGNRDE